MFELTILKIQGGRRITLLVDASTSDEALEIMNSNPEYAGSTLLFAAERVSNNLFVIGDVPYVAPKVAVDFATHAYEFAHGHAPRGRGGWIFEFRRGEYLQTSEGSNFFYGTFTEAKKQARARVQELAAAGKLFPVPEFVTLAVCS